MKEIKVLSSEVVDQIAAGEVVERPAHLVKELIENSLDAGATEVEVEFEHGGRSIRVRDNGSGISKEDLPLAVARHATSKIELSSDIWSLSSFGFRGEALASISAVCRLTIVSRTKEQSQASKLECHFGALSDVQSVGGEVGTSILVEDLFSNVPARLKFLKSDAAEGTQIKNVLRAMAISHPKVTFRVRHRGELLFFWPAKDSRKERVEQVLEFSHMFVGEGEHQTVRAMSVLTSPNQTVKNNRQIWLFVQNRWVQDRGLKAALLDAYRNLLMHGEYPVAAVFVDVAAEDVDVNIHPTKSQVKFRDASAAFRAVLRSARGCLESAPWLSDLLGDAKPQPKQSYTVSMSSKPATSNAFNDPEINRVQYSKKDFPLGQMGVMEQLKAYSPSRNSVSSKEFKQKCDQTNTQEYKHENTSSSAFQSPTDNGGPLASDSASDLLSAQGDYKSPAADSAHWSQLQVLGQLNLTYIVAQSAKSMILVDQHAAHERVMFERLMSAWHNGTLEVQNYLMPITVQLEEEQVEAITGVAAEIEKLGLSVDAVGPDTIAVRAAPAMVNEKSLVKTVELLAHEITDRGGSFAFEKVIGDICATLACHSVVRAGQALSHQQMASLLSQMDEFPLSSFCPHGRPVFVEYNFSRLEKEFGRTL